MTSGPNGIDGIEVKFGRNEKYFGLIRSFTTPLQFVRAGAKIIRSLYYTIGFDASLFLVIHRLNKAFGGGWTHEFFYRGELDLTQTQDEENSVSVNIMEGGLHKLFRANEDTVYEIPVDEIDMKMDGLLLQFSTRYLAITETMETTANGSAFQKNNYVVSLANLPGETSPLNMVANSSFSIPEHIDYGDFATDDRHFI